MFGLLPWILFCLKTKPNIHSMIDTVVGSLMTFWLFALTPCPYTNEHTHG